MGRIAAIGGGTFEETDELNRIIVKMSGKEVPNIVFIGTAAEDSTNPLTSMKKSFKRVCPGVTVRKISLIRNVYKEGEIDEILSWADIIYVGPGNTEFMLSKWREFSMAEKLRKIYEEDSAVLSGMSAGAICWFTKGYTDSEAFTGKEDWKCEVISPDTGVIDLMFCPHYQNWERHGFDSEVEKSQMNGLALTDGAMATWDGKELRYYFSLKNAKAITFTRENGALIRKEYYENIT